MKTKPPTKIYLRENELADHSTQERMVSCDEPFDSCVVEYTNINNLWHHIKEKPKNYALNIVCQLKTGNLTIMNGYGLEVFIAKGYCKRWAYCDDLKPKRR